jgi:polyhydroxyalkanoate synthase
MTAEEEPAEAESACLSSLELLQRTAVEQAIDGADFGKFNKEILRARVASGRSLAIVRKYRDDLERRGVVVLIHGFAQNRYTWHLSTRSLVNYFADAGLDVYNLELTGHGRSREFGTAPANSFEEYVVDTASVIDAVSDYSDCERVFLMGHSLGGAVCYAVAPRVPNKIAGIVTVAGIFQFGSNPVTRQAGRLIGRIASMDSPLTRGGASIKTRFMGKIVAERFGMAEALSASLPFSGWVPGSTEPHVVQERLLKGFDWTGINIFLTLMRWAADGSFDGGNGRDYAREFTALDIPLLVASGDSDRMLPPEDARPAYDRSVSTDKTFKLFSPIHEEVHWGHLDILLGKKAPEFTWPYLLRWLLDRCEGGEALSRERA